MEKEVHSMFKDEIDKVTGIAEHKVQYMMKSPLGYLLLSALAGVYLGFGIVLIFSVGGPIAAGGGGAYLKLIMGASFGVALSLVIFAGSELFTGNNMVFAVGRLRKKVGVGPHCDFIRLMFYRKLFGVGVPWLVDGECRQSDARGRGIDPESLRHENEPGCGGEAFLRGILCNWLVCLAVWVSLRTQSDSAKLILIFWCLFAFIASGFEHSIANQSLLSMAMFLPHGPEISLMGFLHNQLFVTAGNMVGGGVMVGTIYWLAATDFSKEEVSAVNLQPVESKK